MRKVTYHAPTGDYSDVPEKYTSIISPTGFKSLGVWRSAVTLGTGGGR